MNYRWYEYESGVSIVGSGTLPPIALKGDEPISALCIQVRVTGVTGAVTNPADRAITRLKIVDGSTVIYNTRGIAGVPLHFNILGSEPILVNTFLNATQNIATFIIPFGRYLYDDQYAFDPSKFKNPKIEIEYNSALGGMGTIATATCQVYALMFDEKMPSLKGYIMTKEQYSSTLVASVPYVVELPVDHTLKALMIQSVGKAYTMNAQIGTLKLSEDNDKRVIFDESVSNLLKLIFPQKPFHEGLDGYTNTQTQRLHFGYGTYEVQTIAIPENAATDINFVWAYGPNRDIRSSGAANFKAQSVGYCPNGMIYIPFGDPLNPDDWYRMRSDMDLDLKVTPGSCLASSIAQIITQQEALY